MIALAQRLERWTGLPAWAAIGWVSGVAGLLVASLGFYWDVSWHVDLGRDEKVFTLAHTAILVGLASIPVTAALTVAVATATRADVALRWRGWRAPVAAVPLAVLGLGAMAGFPLDELWHRAYGIDVTMWGPTHLTMIGGASFTPIALLLLLREAGPGRKPWLTRHFTAVTCGGVLLGLSTFQLEYDLGVSQWQALYHPVLVAIAGGFALVLARQVLGPGGALLATLHFTIQRVLAYLVVGEALDHTAPHWTLYAGAALAIEFAALARRGWLAAGAGVAVLGLGSEWAWTQVWARWEWTPALFPEVLVAGIAAVAAAALGHAAGRVLSGGRPGLPRAGLVLAGVAVVATLAYPFPRQASDVTATLRTAQAGPGRASLEVEVDRPVDGANRFEVLAWQGGHSERIALRRTGPLTYQAVRPVPVGGSWKTLVRLVDGPRLGGAPVWFPRDDEIGAAEIPVVPERTARLERDTRLLMREARTGGATPAVVAYSAVLGIAVAWLLSLLYAFARLPRRALAGKRIVVTGADGGIGTAVVPALREAGATVTGLDLPQADVTDAASIAAAVDDAAKELGGIDVLVNLAGIGRAQDAGAPPDDEARRTLDVNFFGTWNATAAALPWLVASGGHVIVTASGLATAVVPYAAAYAASKRAVTAYADTLRAEYAGRITVTTVDPGYVRTRIHDVPAADGASLEGVVAADEMDDVVAAYLRAVTDRPRSLATSPRTALNLLLYRANPDVADAVIRRRIERLGRPEPRFVQPVPSPGGRIDHETRVGNGRGGPAGERLRVAAAAGTTDAGGEQRLDGP